MNTIRPEAGTEYSRAQGPNGGDLGARSGRQGPLAVGVLGGGLAGAVLLLVAEFAPLLHVRSGASGHVIDTVTTGSHQSYALLPVAVLAIVFALGVWQTRSRLALLATGLLGVLSLLIALLGDLPDAQASGLIGSATTRFTTASASPAIGLYLETLGAVVLLITAVAGLLLLPAPPRAVRRRRPPRGGDVKPGSSPSASRTRSAS
jgi:hypothetical protein